MDRVPAEEIARAAMTLARALEDLSGLVTRGSPRRQIDPLMQHAREMIAILDKLVANVPDGEPVKVQGREMLDRLSGEFQMLERDVRGGFLQ